MTVARPAGGGGTRERRIECAGVAAGAGAACWAASQGAPLHSPVRTRHRRSTQPCLPAPAPPAGQRGPHAHTSTPPEEGQCWRCTAPPPLGRQHTRRAVHLIHRAAAGQGRRCGRDVQAQVAVVAGSIRRAGVADEGGQLARICSQKIQRGRHSGRRTDQKTCHTAGPAHIRICGCSRASPCAKPAGSAWMAFPPTLLPAAKGD